MHDNFTSLNSTILFDDEIQKKILTKKYEVRHWSYIINCHKEGEQYYIKIPKSEFASSCILDDISIPKNKQMAFDEAISLIELNDMFNDVSPNLSVVCYIGYSKKFNAIITKKFDGEMLYRKSGNCNNEFFETCYSNAAQWLKYFHRNSLKFLDNTNFSIADDFEKINNLLSWLDSYHKETSTNIKIQLSHFINSSEHNFNGLLCYNLPGYELRNFLFDSYGNLCFLDAGKKEIGTIMNDIGRFIVSIDMIRWGKLDAYTNHNFCNYKKAFLSSYFENEEIRYNKILAVYILKWLLIHWHASYERLGEGRVQSFVIPFVRKGYVDYLFKRWVNNCMEILG